MTARKPRAINPSPALERFVRNIEDRLHAKGWDDIALARKTGLRQPTISNLLNRKNATSFEGIDLLARALELDIAELFADPLRNKSQGVTPPVPSAVENGATNNGGRPVEQNGGVHGLKSVGAAISILTPAEARLLQHIGTLLVRAGAAAVLSTANERAAESEHDGGADPHPMRRSTDARGGGVK
jgi:transcriptional regulator with XRE-family HTH domain